mgnify:FL=1
MNEKYLSTIRKIINDKRYYKILSQKEQLEIFLKYLKTIFWVAIDSCVVLIVVKIANIEINLLVGMCLLMILFISSLLFHLSVPLYLVKLKLMQANKRNLLGAYIKDKQELLDVSETGIELLTDIKNNIKQKRYTYEAYQAMMFADFMSIQ